MQSPNLPTWDLMMKNVYNIGSYNLSSEDFVLDVLYQNDKAGTKVNYLPAGLSDKTYPSPISFPHRFGSDHTTPGKYIGQPRRHY